MDERMALGLWKSNFGAVKIAQDDSQGAGHVMGVWVYQKEGKEVVGYFSGPLQGNVLNFVWHEPGDLTGAGYLTFDVNGNSFAGRWWSEGRRRSGHWNGWRTPTTAPHSQPSAAEPDPAAPVTPDAETPAEGSGVNDGVPPAKPEGEFL
jgi:hypothetical protein